MLHATEAGWWFIKGSYPYKSVSANCKRLIDFVGIFNAITIKVIRILQKLLDKASEFNNMVTIVFQKELMTPVFWGLMILIYFAGECRDYC